MREKLFISAVRDRDLRIILHQHGLDSAIDNRELTCESCSTALFWDNIGAFTVKGTSIILYCDSSECLQAAQKGDRHAD
jgi:hypothetical protein